MKRSQPKARKQLPRTDVIKRQTEQAKTVVELDDEALARVQGAMYGSPVPRLTDNLNLK